MVTRQTTTPKKDRRPPWCGVFLESLETTCNVALSSKLAGIHRATAYDYRSRHEEEFGAEWDEAEAIAVGVLEVEARRRAKNGISKGVWHNGERVGEERQYSDTLLIFLLKAHCPDKYRERVSHDIRIRKEDLEDIANPAPCSNERLAELSARYYVRSRN